VRIVLAERAKLIIFDDVLDLGNASVGVVPINGNDRFWHRGENGETYSVKFNPAHRWFYFPEMMTYEALLLKWHDSETDRRARFAPHTAFVDPTTPADAPLRESIELRTLVFHRQ